MDSDDQSYIERENEWDEQWPHAGVEASGGHPDDELDNIDEDTPFPGVVGTPDVIESVRDAEPYMPPTDPPVLPGGRDGIHVATGFGVSPGKRQRPTRFPNRTRTSGSRWSW